MVEHPVAGAVNQWGMPVKPLTRPGWEWVQSPAPTLGRHNDEVLRDVLGLGDAEIATLWESEIVGDSWLPPRKEKQ